jgi:hypothetical protein
MAEVFTTDFYHQQGIPVCPNGDQVRSDEWGLFCWLGGERVPYPIVEPDPEPEPEPEPEPVKPRARKKSDPEVA